MGDQPIAISGISQDHTAREIWASGIECGRVPRELRSVCLAPGTSGDSSGRPFRESEGKSVSESCGDGPQSHIHPARATGPAKAAVAAVVHSELASSPHR
jgi:hypothetical protein